MDRVLMNCLAVILQRCTKPQYVRTVGAHKPRETTTRLERYGQTYLRYNLAHYSPRLLLELAYEAYG